MTTESGEIHLRQADRANQPLVKLSGSEIARQLNLSRSTIHRQIKRSKSEPTALARD